MLNNCFHRITRKGAKIERWPPRALQSFKRLTYIKRPDRQHRDTSIGGSAVLIQIQVPVATHAREIVSCQSRTLPKPVSQGDNS